MSRERRTYEAPDMAAFMGRTLRAMVRRAAEGDREVLSALQQVRDELDAAMRDSARALNDRGSSWAYIGAELGMTRQAAYQRFVRRTPAGGIAATGEHPDQVSVDDLLTDTTDTTDTPGNGAVLV